MTAESLLTELRSRGAKLAVAGDRLHIEAPRGTVSPELLVELRAHKAELLRLLTWPPESFEAERKHGYACARLFPLVDGRVWTPKGHGRLVAILPERAVVILDRRPGALTVLLPSEVGPPHANFQGETLPMPVH